ncbi:unnamed protein product, partial [Mesorhabditis spiculigera]
MSEKSRRSRARKKRGDSVTSNPGSASGPLEELHDAEAPGSDTESAGRPEEHEDSSETPEYTQLTAEEIVERRADILSRSILHLKISLARRMKLKEENERILSAATGTSRPVHEELDLDLAFSSLEERLIGEIDWAGMSSVLERRRKELEELTPRGAEAEMSVAEEISNSASPLGEAEDQPSTSTGIFHSERKPRNQKLMKKAGTKKDTTSERAIGTLTFHQQSSALVYIPGMCFDIAEPKTSAAEQILRDYPTYGHVSYINQVSKPVVVADASRRKLPRMKPYRFDNQAAHKVQPQIPAQGVLFMGNAMQQKPEVNTRNGLLLHRPRSEPSPRRAAVTWFLKWRKERCVHRMKDGEELLALMEKMRKPAKVMTSFTYRPPIAYSLVAGLKKNIRFPLLAEKSVKRSEIEKTLLEPLKYLSDYAVYLPAAQSLPRVVDVGEGRAEFFRHQDRQIEAIHSQMYKTIDKRAVVVASRQELQLPDTRLIEYDCGKLQVLKDLLKRLYAEKHRVLIFTQMAKMLDILQVFLSFHGYHYFRLDGSTGIEQRHAMMEHFNTDPKIFCFILSTRAGGVGINLTGADTVIFYDSDWNPTMDAQAQDRCHRIGQTRHVTIYRMISDRTIEENILKKAMQKRRLGEMAIDEGGFTPDFFKETDNLRDLFKDLAEGDLPTSIEVPKDRAAFEKDMIAVEDAQDTENLKSVRDEAKAENAEFGLTSGSVRENRLDEISQDQALFREVLARMTPIERFALKEFERKKGEAVKAKPGVGKPAPKVPMPVPAGKDREQRKIKSAKRSPIKSPKKPQPTQHKTPTSTNRSHLGRNPRKRLCDDDYIYEPVKLARKKSKGDSSGDEAEWKPPTKGAMAITSKARGERAPRKRSAKFEVDTSDLADDASERTEGSNRRKSGGDGSS